MDEPQARSNFRQAGFRLHPDQHREVSDLALERGEKFSSTLRLVLRIGLQHIREMRTAGKLVA